MTSFSGIFRQILSTVSYSTCKLFGFLVFLFFLFVFWFLFLFFQFFWMLILFFLILIIVVFIVIIVIIIIIIVWIISLVVTPCLTILMDIISQLALVQYRLSQCFNSGAT